MGNMQTKKVKEKWSPEGVLKTKGLSKLQRAILGLAGNGPRDYFQLTTREIMIKLFDWMPARTPDYSGGQSFDVRMIGRKEYRKRMVSVSRSLGRLCHRGLMKRCLGSGHWLTEAGREYVDCDNG
ncbi:hypothetical protein HRM2_17380 [Desulforapulum autotrophicum HRM2]|uniref:Restriction system protein Mrr-like N-terminal domain-containing protein n=1 Tax=Desulforapulum autotrophicum (strain ATCC 43914 / DSM 3382 / VKM B-1955 / HRM2) TaxID=177437 RepID=C0QB45_DESAH|nr:hypothetical protein [Desulforapulum autotrophicum]ACN14844.1 hypothetical protein HRM2_17380 [Desulforapulum autotrophicum HRM2]